MSFTIRILAPADLSLLSHVAPDVFDDPIHEESAKKFLKDPNAFLVVAILCNAVDQGGAPDPLSPPEDDEGLVIGFASAVKYFHPDKEKSEMWINEVGVAPAYRRQGVGKAVMKMLLAEAKAQGCALAWLAVDEDNEAALALYRSAGGAAPEKQIHVDFDVTRDDA